MKKKHFGPDEKLKEFKVIKVTVHFGQNSQIFHTSYVYSVPNDTGFVGISAEYTTQKAETNDLQNNKHPFLSHMG